MRWFGTIFGVRGDLGVVRYEHIGNIDEKASSSDEGVMEENPLTYRIVTRRRSSTQRIAANLISRFSAVFHWTLPWINLNAGQRGSLALCRFYQLI